MCCGNFIKFLWTKAKYTFFVSIYILLWIISVIVGFSLIDQGLVVEGFYTLLSIRVIEIVYFNSILFYIRYLKRKKSLSTTFPSICCGDENITSMYFTMFWTVFNGSLISTAIIWSYVFNSYNDNFYTSYPELSFISDPENDTTHRFWSLYAFSTILCTFVLQFISIIILRIYDEYLKYLEEVEKENETKQLNEQRESHNKTPNPYDNV